MIKKCFGFIAFCKTIGLIELLLLFVLGLSIEDIDYKKYPEKSFQESWIRVYLEELMNVAAVSDEEVEKLLTQVSQMSLASHFLWGVWSLVQYELSDINYDFGR